ncbi:MAG: translocation/assembly module TamB domain-containing protein, partial [Acidobacteriota bacterium]
ELTGSNIDISGSPRDPRLQGSINVQRGEFKIPLTRANFTSTRGTIDFTSNERAANPSLNIQSDAPDYQDLSGQQHVISLAITGTLEQPLWDLHTNTGLDKSQTLALLFLGRSPEQLRRSLGDQSIGVVNPTAGEVSTNPSGTFGDQLVKDLAGDWVSQLLGNSLLKIAPVDILRFELGFGSVGVHAEKKLLENIRLLGDAESTVRGYSLNVRGEIRTPYNSPIWFCHRCRITPRDRLSVQGGFLDKIYSDPADQALNITDLQGKFVYRLFIP